jgi:hypothetical protein
MAQGWEGIERYGKAKKAWLSWFLKLEHGISHPEAYRRAIKQEYEREIIAIDGKTI